MSAMQQTEIFTLPIESARLKTREILDQFPQAGYEQSAGNIKTARS
jgi:hypothetical protein